MSTTASGSGNCDSGTTVEEKLRFVTFRVCGELLGIRVDGVQEVLTARRIAAVPRVPSEVAGFINLRGQIVTAIDLRARLNLEPLAEGASWMNVVVKDGGELFSLVVDEVGDVIDVRSDLLGPPPATLGSAWRSYCQGVFQLERGLLIALDVKKILEIDAGESC